MWSKHLLHLQRNSERHLSISFPDSDVRVTLWPVISPMIPHKLLQPADKSIRTNKPGVDLFISHAMVCRCRPLQQSCLSLSDFRCDNIINMIHISPTMIPPLSPTPLFSPLSSLLLFSPLVTYLSLIQRQCTVYASLCFGCPLLCLRCPIQ